MTLETLYYVSQIVAVLAILGSLVFVGVQIRQNTKQAEEAERVARGQVLQHIAAEHRQHSLTTVDYFYTAVHKLHGLGDIRPFLNLLAARSYSVIVLTVGAKLS